MKHHIKDLQSLFHRTFQEDYNISLQFGADEPFYYAAKNQTERNILYSREDFFASALHEIAHWCLAGIERRKQDDYGFWYSPDGRDIDKQLEFEKVEIKPQAIEKAFSLACNFPFKASADNLSLENYDSSPFIESIDNQLTAYQDTKFPKRAEKFISALRQQYS